MKARQRRRRRASSCSKLFENVPVLDAGARGATTTFAQRGIGDVLIAWENEAILIGQEFGADKFEIVYPSLSILAEPPVAVVDKVVDKKGTRKAAEAYLELPVLADRPGDRRQAPLPPARRGGARRSTRATSRSRADCSPSTSCFGGWAKAQKEHFDDGGIFDQILQPRRS